MLTDSEKCNVTTQPQSTDAPVSTTQWPMKKPLFDVGISITDYNEAVAAIINAASAKESGLVSAYAVHAVIHLTATPEMRQIANDFDMITPDGQPVRWAMNWLHRVKMSDRVYGPELMLRVCEQAADQGLPIYLYGGTPIVLQKLEANLLQRYPRLQVVGREDPPFRPLSETELDDVVKRINDSGAAILFIGLGCPKQDVFAHEIRERVQVVQLCVGAAFDFHAGVKLMAPLWMQKSGLEWLFRLYQEPQRLWKRYLTTNLVFLYRLSREILGTRRKGLTSGESSH